jgi:predicted lipid-binding transport protein (Tim44 family)
MPQDADSSGLISLIWAAWIYWNVYWWLHRQSSPEHAEKDRQEGNRPSFAENGGTAAGPVPPRLEALVSEILRRDGAAEVDDFLRRRLAAYEATIAAFDAGDRDTLRELVSAEVYDVFSQAIAARESRQQASETVFSQIDPPEIVDGLIDETHMEVSVRFVGECFKLFRNAAGEPVHETPDRCRSADIWTFGRTLSSREHAWRVLATEAGVR